MNEDNVKQGNDRDGSDEPDALALLISAAGRREAPPADAYRQVFAATHEVWKGKVRRRSYWRAANAIAAGVAVIAVSVGLWTQRGADHSAPMAVAVTDVVVGGAAMLAEARSGWINVSDRGAPIMPGSRLRTDPDGGAGLLLADDISLRLDGSTEVLFETANRVRLLAGAVYVDTGPDATPAPMIEIVTDGGVFRDVGTQFEVRRVGAVLRLRVREGLVRLSRPGGELEAGAGHELALHPDGDIRRQRVSSRDPEWRWIHAVAPAPYAADQSLTGLLEWIGRETGRGVRFADPTDAAAASRTTLHGSPRRLLPMEALSVMLATTDFEFTLTTEGDIVVSASR